MAVAQARSLLSHSLIVVVLLWTAPNIQAQTANGETHIEIVFQSRNQDSSDSRRQPELDKLNLSLSVGDSKTPFRLTSAKKGVFATHLLIVLPTPLAECAAIGAPEGLASVLGAGSNLALAGSDGRWTPWASGPGAWNSACSLSDKSFSVASGPLHMLQAQVGRRVLLYASAQPDAVLARARQMIPEIYVVDGGGRVKISAPARAMAFPASNLNLPPSPQPNIPSQYSEHTSFAPDYAEHSAAANRWQFQNQVQRSSKGSRQEGYLNGEMHVRSMQHAFKAIRQASVLYYDVAFSLPLAASSIAPIELKFKFMPEFSAHTDIYSETQTAASVAGQRTPVAAPFKASDSVF